MTTTTRSLRAGIVLLSIIHHRSARAQGMREEHDIPYLTGATPAQALDAYLPATAGYPTIVFFHGGSLAGGDKADEPTARICANFVANGIGCISANYRFGPDITWPTHANDAAAAVAWAIRNLGKRGADTSHIYLMGHSSGCMLASLLGTDPKYLAPYRIAPASVRGVIAMGCLLGQIFDTAGIAPARVTGYFGANGPLRVFGSIDLLVDASPTRHVSGSMPAFLVLIAAGEQVNPPILAHANQFVVKARDAGASPLPLIRVLPDRVHYSALNEMANPNDPTLQLVIRFIRTGAL